MSSIVYNGRSFAPYVSAELVEPVAHALSPETAQVPGRPGLALVSADVAPLELRVRLFLDAPDALSPTDRAQVRRTLRAWLLATGAGTLSVPGEEGLEWRDALCTGVSTWSTLFAEGNADVTFLCLDPIAYGAEATAEGATFTVGGTWPTWPVFELTAAAGAGAAVSCPSTGKRLAIGRPLSAGDAVVFDCGAQTAAVDDADATADVTLESDFFPLAPGPVELAFEGCTAHVARWRERWA